MSTPSKRKNAPTNKKNRPKNRKTDYEDDDIISSEHESDVDETGSNPEGEDAVEEDLTNYCDIPELTPPEVVLGCLHYLNLLLRFLYDYNCVVWKKKKEKNYLKITCTVNIFFICWVIAGRMGQARNYADVWLDKLGNGRT